MTPLEIGLVVINLLLCLVIGFLGWHNSKLSNNVTDIIAAVVADDDEEDDADWWKKPKGEEPD